MAAQKKAQSKTAASTPQSTTSNPKQYGGNTGSQKSLAEVGLPPSAEQVAQFHQNSDSDTRKEAQHHTLGINPYQASPGDHTHDGGTSPLLLSGSTITGARGSAAWASSVNAILVKLGATDSSTST